MPPSSVSSVPICVPSVALKFFPKLALVVPFAEVKRELRSTPILPWNETTGFEEKTQYAAPAIESLITYEF